MSDHDHSQPNIKLYLGIFIALLGLTVVTVGVSYWHLPPGPAIGLGLLIASVKAGLVAAYFMHLKGEQAVIFSFLGITAFFLLVLFSIPIVDSLALSDRAQHVPIVMDAPHHDAHEAPAHH